MKIKVLHSETQAEIKELNLTHVLREGESCFIGRSQNSGLMLDSPGISRLHAKFLHQHGQYYFCDLGSSNGSIVKSERAIVNQNYLVQPGDVIRLGDFVLLLEAVPEPSIDLAQTVIGGLDATVVAGDTPAIASMLRDIPPNVEPQADEQDSEEEPEPIIVAELVEHESSALVKVDSHEADYSLQSQTKALFTAVNQRVLAELRAAGNLTRDTYLKAIHRARESIERDRLIDPEQFEKEAEKYWQSLSRNASELGVRLGTSASRGVSNLGSRLSAAAKAAWSEFLTHQPKITKQQLEASEQQDQSTSKHIVDSTENPAPERKIDQSEL